MIPFHTPHPVLKRARVGLTLIEILIALTMTLIVLGAMMSAFQYASAEMQNGRAMLEMANRVRVAENLLRRDLANLTVEPRPYIGKVIPNGYFEYVEGPQRDLKVPFTEGLAPNPPGSNAPLTTSSLSYLGDSDDILAMTCRSIAGSVFRGRLFGSTTTPNIESAYAEIVWWTRLNETNNDLVIDYPESQDLFRRVLLINPDLDATDGLPAGVSLSFAMEWLARSDISARLEPVTATTYNVVANSLQDLANRENRAFRRPITTGVADANSVNTLFAFPYPLNRTTLAALRTADDNSTGFNFDGDTIPTGIIYNGNDIVLTDIAAFDVKVFSPDCALDDSVAGTVLEPGDPGYPNITAGVVVDADGDGIPDFADGGAVIIAGTPQGAFVDLGHHGGGQFSQTITPPTPFYSAAGTSAQRSPLNYRFLFESLASPTAYDASTPAFSLLITDMIETVYDTWTPTYESDGINQDPAVVHADALPVAGGVGNATTNIDQGTNGIDDVNPVSGTTENGPDDYNERETQPPYNYPISGLKVTIRLIEKQSGEVRQSSIVHSYGAQ